MGRHSALTKISFSFVAKISYFLMRRFLTNIWRNIWQKFGEERFIVDESFAPHSDQNFGELNCAKSRQKCWWKKKGEMFRKDARDYLTKIAQWFVDPNFSTITLHTFLEKLGFSSRSAEARRLFGITLKFSQNIITKILGGNCPRFYDKIAMIILMQFGNNSGR